MSDKTAIFLEYRPLLFSMAYNMLGVVQTAEDIVQDTYLKWLDTPVDAVRHTKAFLVRMATNQCINYLNTARSRREKYIGIWLPEPLINYPADHSEDRITSYHALSIGLLV